MQVVAYAQHLADRARAAIALSAQAISETEMMMMQFEGQIEAAVSSTPVPHPTPPPGPPAFAPCAAPARPLSDPGCAGGPRA